MQHHAATTGSQVSLSPSLGRSLFVAALAGLLVPAAAPAATPEAPPEPLSYYEQQLVWLEEETAHYADAGKQWPVLLAEFRRALAARRDSLVPGLPPLGEHNRITDFEVRTDGLGLVWAEWTYVNAGDYNLNGEVNYQDLLELNTYLGARENDERWASARLCDGNGDGLIDIADVSAIVNNFGNCVQYYRVVSDALPPQGHPSSIYRTLELGQISQAEGERPVLGTVGSQTDLRLLAEPPHYQCELDMRRASVFIWVEPVAAQLETPSNVAGEDRLTVRLDAGQLGGAVPAAVTLDCSGSIGQEEDSWTKPFADVEWDVNGDERYSAAAVEEQARGNKQCAVAFSEPRCYLAAVRVTDLDGAQQTARRPFCAFQQQPLPAQLEELVFIAGRPSYIYREQTEDGQLALYFVSATDSGQWKEPQLVATPVAEAAYGLALASINGSPAAAYIAAQEADTAGELYFVRASDADGRDWQAPVLINDQAEAHEYGRTQLLALDGRPAVAYTQLTAANGDGVRGQELLFQLATNETGRSWDAPAVIVSVTADDRSSYESFTSPNLTTLRLIGERPALLYHGYNLYGSVVSLALANDRLGTSWGEPQGIHQSYTSNLGGGGLGSGLLELAGTPAYLLRSWTLGTFGGTSHSTLQTGAGESAQTLNPRELPFSRHSPFFGTGSDSLEGRDEQLSAIQFSCAGGEDYSALALVSLRNSTTRGAPGHGVLATSETKLCVAYTADGAAWQLSPSFNLGNAVYHVLGGQCRRLPDEFSGVEYSWLQLFLTVETSLGMELWITHVKLDDWLTAD